MKTDTCGQGLHVMNKYNTQLTTILDVPVLSYPCTDRWQYKLITR